MNVVRVTSGQTEDGDGSFKLRANAEDARSIGRGRGPDYLLRLCQWLHTTSLSMHVYQSTPPPLDEAMESR